MNRRTAIQSLLAGLAAPLAWCKPAKASVTTINVGISSATLSKQIAALRDPDFIPLPEGVLGKTYFNVLICSLPLGKRLFLDGVDVTCRCGESDCVGGWARLIDIDANDKRIWSRRRTHYGKVEIR